MKSLLFAYVIALLAILAALHAQPMEVNSILSLGVIPGHTLSLYEVRDYERTLNVSATYTADYQVTADIYKYAFVTGGMTCYSWMSRSSFWPFRTDYTLGAGAQWGRWKIRWDHACYHPLAPGATELPLPVINYAQNAFTVSVKIGKNN